MPQSHTTRLKFPLFAPGQTLKHITHNEALERIDGLLHLNIKGEISTPPLSATIGDIFRVSPQAEPEWVEHIDKIAHFLGSHWKFELPVKGQVLWNAELNRLEVWNGELWVQASAPDNAELTTQMLGVNTTADFYNRVAIASAGSLFTHDGDSHRLAINKASETDTASILFQSSYDGLAEVGMSGDNDLHVKVKTDDTGWQDSLIVSSQTARVAFPAGLAHPIAAAPLSTLIPTPGGDGEVSIFRNNRSRLPQPRIAELSSIENDTLTLTTESADDFFNSIMEGVSLVQIWNVSKPTAAPAWVKASPNPSALTVYDASTLEDWLPGDIIQIGTPSSISARPAIVLDISPMMQNYFGHVFPQSGVVVKIGCGSATTAQSKLFVGGSVVGGAQIPLSSYPGGEYAVGQLTLPCNEPSPISNSNLIYLTEKTQAGHQLSTSLVSVNFLMV